MTRKSFNLYFLAIVGMLVVSVSSFGEQQQADDHKSLNISRPTANEILKGTIVIKAVDLKTDHPFLRVTTKDGVKDYRIDVCNEACELEVCNEACEKDINLCKGGEQCAIRGKVEEAPPSIRAEFVTVGAAATSGELRKTKTGQEFHKVSEEELKNLGKINVKACVGKEGKEGAWAEPDYKDGKGDLVKGKIWCGDVARDKKGNIRTMNQEDADTYCKSNGLELPSGWTESENAKNGNRDSDHVRLSKVMGASDDNGKGYWPYIQGSQTETVLPHLLYPNGRSRRFWSSSSLLPDFPSLAYVFLGRFGVIDCYDRTLAIFNSSARCVVARR